jgi:oxalate decarboxylase/phosphoglucose isomerase-like protein (cupin superfamily)
MTGRRTHHPPIVSPPRIRPGQSSSEDFRNEHRWAEQWRHVVAGTGTARVSGRTVRLREGSLLLVGKGEPHVIRDTGRSDLVTVNIYAPPAYRTDGDPLAWTPRSGSRWSQTTYRADPVRLRPP